LALLPAGLVSVNGKALSMLYYRTLLLGEGKQVSEVDTDDSTNW